MANYCCSIETEPRTLKQGQLNYAREIAVDIVQKKEPDEASSVLIEGAKPVVEIKETLAVVVRDATQPEKAAAEESSREIIIKGEINVETYCQCSSTARASTDSSPEEPSVKEPLSAPF